VSKRDEEEKTYLDASCAFHGILAQGCFLNKKEQHQEERPRRKAWAGIKDSYHKR